MVIYFSGTGNSRFAAEYMAKALNDELLNANERIKAGESLKCTSDLPWVFVAPTYGWQLPRVFEAWLRHGELIGSRDAYFVLTCGSDIGAAGKYAQQMCVDIGLNYRGILGVVMPENYVAMFPVPNEEKSIEIVKKALPALDRGIHCIKQGVEFPQQNNSIFDQLKSGPVNNLFYKKIVKADAFLVKEGCISCGTCVSVCPLNNIRLEQGQPLWGENCTHCMACICDCPVEVIEYGKKSRGKPRYHCPDME